MHEINFLGFVFCFSGVTSLSAKPVLKGWLCPALPKLECYGHAFYTR